jgi:DNA-directed RNA polymerase I, II, and III subunit RPABC2
MPTPKNKSKNTKKLVIQDNNKSKQFLKRADKEKDGDLDKLEQDKDIELSTDDESEDEKIEEKEGDIEEVDDETIEEDDDKKSDKIIKKNVDDEGCLYNFTKVDPDEEDDDDDIGIEDDEPEVNIKDNEKMTKPYLTKYERVRALGARAKQISMGAKPMLKNIDNLSAKEIAKLELENKVMPFIIERPLPNGKVEIWNINDLIIAN